MEKLTVLAALYALAALLPPVDGAEQAPQRVHPYRVLAEGINYIKTGRDALKDGDLPAACEAFRRADAAFGSPVLAQPPDAYGKLSQDKTYPEAYCLLKNAEIYAMLGSLRLSKAGFRLVMDRFPDLHKRREGKLVPMADEVKLYYTETCRLCGDGEDAHEPGSDGETEVDTRFLSLQNKIIAALKEERWQDVLADCRQLMQDYGQDERHPHYHAWAVFNAAVAQYALHDYEGAVRNGEALLADGGKLMDAVYDSLEWRETGKRSLYTILACCLYELGRYPECIALCAKFQAEFPQAPAQNSTECRNALILRSFCISSHYKLQDYGSVIQEGEALLAEGAGQLAGIPVQGLGQGGYVRQMHYFVLHAYYELKDYAKCVELCDRYLADFAETLTQDSFAQNVQQMRTEALRKQAAGTVSEPPRP